MLGFACRPPWGQMAADHQWSEDHRLRTADLQLHCPTFLTPQATQDIVTKSQATQQIQKQKLKFFESHTFHNFSRSFNRLKMHRWNWICVDIITKFEAKFCQFIFHTDCKNFANLGRPLEIGWWPFVVCG